MTERNPRGTRPEVGSGVKRYLSFWVWLGIVFGLPLMLGSNADALRQWLSTPAGRASLDILKGAPYVCLLLSAAWAARIANAPVYVLSLALIPAHYYFSGGGGFGGQLSGDQMKFVLFLLLPILVAAASFVSHRTLTATLKTGLWVIALGFFLPPVLSALFGRRLVTWIGIYRWDAAAFLGVPSPPTIYYLSVFVLTVALPFAGREGQMKKILSLLIPCFYFSAVFNPIFRSGPLFPPGLEHLYFAVFGTIGAFLALYANVFLSWSKAYVDDLTQVLSRRALNETMGRLAGVYSIAMVDVDHFKKFNDTYGHAAGDVVLREVAGILSRESGGRVYRYGGEEFSVLFQDVGADEAASRMDHVRRILSDAPISLNGAPNGAPNGASSNKRDKKVTVHFSAGVAERGKKLPAAEEVIQAADRALYQAKENGRNRVERAG